ncbi:hypothetical protein [Azotobacter beijerinckii]|uniref:hypothetical protein n=1 Tax=Azotobacter beijerinckii TaxID=170623 RepID=UPI001160C9FC|nr:hypothetical protein [Azotobacter beijerinckii]
MLDTSQVGNGWRKTNRRGREKEAQQGADNGADISESVRTDVRSESFRTDESPAPVAERIALVRGIGSHLASRSSPGGFDVGKSGIT